MKEIIFKCETITPLFLGEAKKGEVELRPPAIKSAMRFWWRAAHAHLSLPDLKKNESDIFGGGGENAKSAKFDIVLFNPSKEPVPFDYRGDFKKHKNIENIAYGSLSGIHYLIYTFLHLKKTGKYFPVGTTFEVAFYFKHNDPQIQQVLASFWLLVFLGNIGERSRRGMGCIKVNSVQDDKKLCGELDFIKYDELALKAGLERIKVIYGYDKVLLPRRTNSYSNIFNTEVFISNKAQSTWDKALIDIGTKMHDFRLENNEEAISNSEGHLKADKSAIFGLPIKHSDGSVVQPKDSKLTRRASPLIIKIIKLKENVFKWILIRLEGDFLPIDNNDIISKRKGTITRLNKADENILNKFITELTPNMKKL